MSNITPVPGNSNPITRPKEVIRTTGDLKIVLSDQDQNITLDTSTGSTIVMGLASIDIVSSGANIRISGGVVTIGASVIRLDAGIVTARMIQCDTIVAQSVVGASYTPGAGNIW